ncbi:MAG: Fe-S-binding domain-containing protein [Ignavibacteriales bacterium UTCHB1]|nr:MAG: Fe-S-binding domain-containing protein [Ignavibacteriales bacterium UTCHB1]
MPNILSILIFLPVVLAIPVLFFKKESETLIKSYTLGVSILTFMVSLLLFINFDASTGQFQFVEKTKWINFINTNYFVGIDGISLLLILLSTFIIPLTIIASWKTIKTKVKAFYFLMLLMLGGLIGVFCALDLLLFYVFWEFILIPMYFMIGIWGSENRIYATVKFFIYTVSGSVLLLVGIIWLGFLALPILGTFSTDLIELKSVSYNLPVDSQIYLFILFTLSFMIKVPLFPLHTWLPDAHVQAPTAGSVILASLLLKMGTYALIRFSLTLFPAGFVELTPYFAALSVIGIIYGALLSIVQKDMKKLVAYSSVSHMGFIVLGTFALTAEAIQGSVIQMINHGLSTGALFLIVGILYERRHTKEIAKYGGVMKVMPVFSVIFLIVVMSSIGLPGLNGFIGEFLVLIGSFYSPNLGSHWYAIISTTVVIFAAVYLLWLYQRIMLGPLDKEENKNIKDINKTELVTLIPLVIFIVWIGVQPNTFLKVTEKSVEQIIVNIKTVTPKFNHLIGD